MVVENNDPLRRNGKQWNAWVVWDPLTRRMTNWCDCNHMAWVKHYDPPLPAREQRGTATVGRPEGVTAYLGPANARMRYDVQALPAQDLLCLSTVGTKAVRTVPAGKDGNDHDLTWIVQSWYSPELKLALVTIVDDPLKGIAKYEFRNLKRAEPDPSLFVVPGGYTVKDAVPLHAANSAPALPDYQ